MTKINLDLQESDYAVVSDIAYRAVKLGLAQRLQYIDVILDVSVTHLNGCPLDLAGLLAAKEQDFSHDILGIRRLIDLKTGKLKDPCFVPRCAKKEGAA